MDAVPAAIEGLRPGQTGVVVLGRVIMGDIAVTLVDLIQRGFLTVEETTDHGDWRLTSVTGTGTNKHELGGVLLDYEKRLLDGLSEDGGESRLSSLAARFGKALDETRKVLIRDAVHQGWLRHLRHDQRTAEAEELAGHVRFFRRDLGGWWLTETRERSPDSCCPMPFASACCPIRGRRWSGSRTPGWGLSSTCRAGRRRSRSVRSTSAISRFSVKSRQGRG
jgi:Predicted membrane protein (DUF2207)